MHFLSHLLAFEQVCCLLQSMHRSKEVTFSLLPKSSSLCLWLFLLDHVRPLSGWQTVSIERCSLLLLLLGQSAVRSFIPLCLLHNSKPWFFLEIILAFQVLKISENSYASLDCIVAQKCRANLWGLGSLVDFPLLICSLLDFYVLQRDHGLILVFDGLNFLWLFDNSCLFLCIFVVLSILIWRHLWNFDRLLLIQAWFVLREEGSFDWLVE